MDGTVIAALITGPLSFAGGIVAIVLTQRGSKKRDHEADWRKMKLEHHKAYIAASSEVVNRGSDYSALLRYANASVSIALVAPPRVLIALYTFQNGLKSKDSKPNDLQAMWSSLVRAMRYDCHPEDLHDSPEFVFETIGPGPINANNGKELRT
jgi:hypothetical protein